MVITQFKVIQGHQGYQSKSRVCDFVLVIIVIVQIWTLRF